MTYNFGNQENQEEISVSFMLFLITGCIGLIFGLFYAFPKVFLVMIFITFGINILLLLNILYQIIRK